MCAARVCHVCVAGGFSNSLENREFMPFNSLKKGWRAREGFEPLTPRFRSLSSSLFRKPQKADTERLGGANTLGALRNFD